MKVVITGHTSGIGKAIISKIPHCVGISRSNGFDINNVTEVVNYIKDFDVFINNAYCGYRQAELLQELWPLWKDKEKTIISISSLAANSAGLHEQQYANHKKALTDVSKSYSNQIYSPCRVANINIGYVDVDSVSDVEHSKINVNEVANLVWQLINSRGRSFWIGNMDVYPTINN